MKKFLSLLLAVMMVVTMLPVAALADELNLFAADEQPVAEAPAEEPTEEPVEEREIFAEVPTVQQAVQNDAPVAYSDLGSVHVVIENTTFTVASETSDNKAPAWKGTLLDMEIDLTADSSMMSCIVDAIVKKGYTQVGADLGYISEINGLAEKQNGSESGWMGSLNDWFTNEGFDKYTVKDGKLKAGDEIRIMYSSSGSGTDLGSDWSSSDKSLANLAVSGGELSPAFSKDNHEYTVILATGVDSVTVTPTATNKQFQARIFIGETEYSRNAKISVKEGTVITVKCGDPDWESGAPNSGEAQIYTIKIVCAGSMLGADSITLKTIKEDSSGEGADIALTYDSATATFNGNLSQYTHLKEYNDAGFIITLSGLPEGATVKLTAEDGTKLVDFIGGKATVNNAVKKTGTFNFYIVITNGSKEESYKLSLNKANKYYWNKFELVGTPVFDSAKMFFGQPEGTLFQVDDNGNITDKVGISEDCWNYIMYVSPAIKTVKPKTVASLVLYGANNFYTSLYLNGEEYIKNSPTFTAFNAKLRAAKQISIEDDKTVLEFVFKSKNDENLELRSTVTIIVYKLSTEEFIDAINAMPGTDNLVYSEHYDLVQGYKEMYDAYSDEEKAQIPKETLEKIEAALKRVEVLKERHENGIQNLVDILDRCYGKATDENYKEYLDDTRNAVVIYLGMSDAQRKEIKSTKYKDTYVDNAFWQIYNDIILRSIKYGDSIGYPTDYPDDFIIQSGYYNLDLGHEDTYYETCFREIWTNRPSTYYNYGEKGLPFTSPGLLEFEIKDESIFEIKEVEDSYTDLGLGGSGSHANMRYYLVPKKAGTTTFVVKMRDETGTMYCQTPEMVVHVNSPEETEIEDLSSKLTNFKEIKYTRNYDNWSYEYGEEGASFTFHINGSDGKVWVYEYLKYNSDGTPVKTEYKPDKNGDVTVLLKDGYNCIEVNANYEGKNVTQVYSLKGKVVRFVTENISRPGEALRLGDTAGVWTIGRQICLHKISRIYNNGNGATNYMTDMPHQSLLKVDSNGTIDIKYIGFVGCEKGSFSRLYVPLTASGTITLHDGVIVHKGYGSTLGSELTQGNTGGIADTTGFEFGRLANITLNVEDNPEYVAPEYMSVIASNGGVVKAGESITITVPELPVDDILKQYEPSENKLIKNANMVFYSDIPGCTSIEKTFNRYANGYDVSYEDVKNGMEDLKSVTFTIPEDTLSGTYTIRGGYLYLWYTSGWMDQYTELYKGEMDDVVITVLPGDSELVNIVEVLINAIGEVTKDSGKAISDARSAYDSLSDELKERVGNYNKLIYAEREYNSILHADDEPIHIVIGAATNAAAKGEENPNTGAEVLSIAPVVLVLKAVTLPF